MVDQLVDTLGDIAKRAQDLMPHIIEHGLKEQLSLDETDAVPRSILRNRIHNSMEDLANGVGGDGLGSSGLTRVSVRRSFRTIKRKISNSRSNVRQHQSTDRLLVARRPREHQIERRHCLSGELDEHLDVVNGAPVRVSASSSTIRAASLGSKSTDSMLVEQAHNWGSRPPSSASCDLIQSHSAQLITELETKPPIPPKSTRPLGGIYVFNQLKRNSLMSIESNESELPPELPVKVSPTKSHRDSGYEIEQNVRKSIDLNELSENARPLELLDLILSGSKVEKDLLELFLSSYRTFMNINKLIDALLKRIRQVDTCLKNNALHLLIRVLDQMVHTELTDELHETLSEEIFWMMTHREHEFMKFAQKLRDNIRKKWKLKPSQVEPLPATDVEILAQLRDTGQRLLQFSSERIAEQLSLVEAENFRLIDSSEFVICSKEDTLDRSLVPNFAKAVDHFNNLSYWTQGIILSQEENAQDVREKILWKLFNVLDQLKQQKNFNSYFACVSGVNSCAITRLNWPRGAYRERLSSLSEFTDVEKNFVNYREKLKTCNAPCLPYIGLIKRDLYQVHLREKSLTADGCVNIKKARKLHNHLEYIRRFRHSKYDYQKDTDLIRIFGGFRCIQNDDVLWRLSYELKRDSSEL